MKVFNGAIRIETTMKTGEVDITVMAEAVISQSKIEEGSALVHTGHTTGAVHLNNADEDLGKDFHDAMSALFPKKDTYRHNKGDYGRNADAHLKSAVVGNSITIPVTKGRLVLGQWQAVYFSEFDGPRNRLISIKVIGQ